MQLPRTDRIAASFELLDEVGSTNAELLARASAGARSGAPLPHLTVLATTNQIAGRGRLDRSWVAPPGTALAVSVLLAPPAASIARLGWMPLLAGLAMCRAVRELLPQRPVSLKWPNDVLVDDRKVSGILGEVVQGQDAVVIGAGLNLSMREPELPVPTATSLAIEGADPVDLLDRALSGYLAELHGLLGAFVTAGYDPDAGLRDAVRDACSTIGAQVRVERPHGELLGRAVDLDADGRLVVESDEGRIAVAVGDVTHVRRVAEGG